ncbi:MAG: hypothetical protein P8X62_10605 [Flavobacteriaceae bacterium]
MALEVLFCCNYRSLFVVPKKTLIYFHLVNKLEIIAEINAPKDSVESAILLVCSFVETSVKTTNPLNMMLMNVIRKASNIFVGLSLEYFIVYFSCFSGISCLDLLSLYKYCLLLV